MTELDKDSKNQRKKTSLYRRLRNWWLSFNVIKRWLTVWAILLVTYTLLGFFAVPAIVKHTLTTELTQLLGRTVSIEKVYWNPFSLVFELENFKILDSKQKEATFALDRLHLNLETASLYKWSLVVKQIEIDHPQLSVSRIGMNEFSFDDIIKLVQEKIKNAQETEQPEKESPSLLSKLDYQITNIAIHGGMFYFNDEFALKKHSLTDFEFVIPLVSNFSQNVNEFIQPKISGKINGSTFGGKSDLKPFVKSRESFIDLTFKDFDLAFLTKYLPEFVKPKLVSCLVDSDLSLAFDMNKHDQPYLSLQGGFSVRDVDVTLDHDYGSGSKPESIFKLERLSVGFGASNLLASEVFIKKIEIVKPYASVKFHKSGRFNLANCLDPVLLNKFLKDLEPEEKQKSNPTSIPDLKIGQLVVTEGQFQFADNYDSRNYQATIDNFNFSVQDFSTTEEEPAKLQLSLNGPNNLVVTSTGELTFFNKKLNLAVNVSGVELTQFSPYYQPFLNSKLDSGVLSLNSQVDINFNSPVNITITNTDVKLKNFLVIDQKEEDLIAIPSLEIKLNKLDLKERTLDVSSVVVDGGGINVVRDKKFDINLSKIVKLKKIESFIASITEPEAKKSTIKTTPAPAARFSYAINQVQVKSFGLSFTDQALIEESDFIIFPINVSVNNFSSDENQPIALKLAAAINTNSKFDLDSKISIDQKKIESNVKITDFQLDMLNPYLTQLMKITIKDGSFNASSKLDLDLKDLKNPMVKLNSTCSVDQFHLQGDDERGKFISGNQVKISNFVFSNAPLKVEIGKIFAQQLSATVELDSEKGFSVEKLVRKDRLEELADNPKTLVSIIEQHIKNIESFNMAINETELKGGAFYFTDRTVTPNYELKVIKTDLTLDRIATNEVKDSHFKISSTTYDGSTMDVTGVVNPFKKPFALSFSAKVRVDDLSRFTPYSGKYVGYEINKGKSELELDYKVENNKLIASNNVFINQFSFGNDVDSDEATSLPVRFALAIITDKNGNLELKLPVSGDLNDPDFSISSAILTVTKNILTNIVSSPFSFLGSLYGGPEDIKSINYQPGSSELTDTEIDKLNVLIKILQDRPGLKLEINAHATDSIDRPMLLQNKLNKFIQECWYAELSESEQKQTTPSAIKVDKKDTEKYLEMIELAYEKGDFEKEVNFFNIVKSQPLEVMLAKLKDHFKVSDQELYKLALDRGRVISKYLLSKKVSKSTIFLTEPKLNQTEVKTASTLVLK